MQNAKTKTPINPGIEEKEIPGYYYVIGACAACGRGPRGAFNPDYVPAIRIEGQREPLCSGCHAKWNDIHRVSKGLPPLPLHPQAYEPQPEIE